MHSKTGLESLAQRGRSDLYKDLVSLYQDSINALSGVKNPVNDDVYTALKTIDFRSKLKAIVQRHMGVTLAGVSVAESIVPNMMISSAIIKLPFENIQTLTVGTIRAAIANHYNDRTGKFDKALPQKIIPYRLLLSSANWIIKDKNSNPYFTAEELAAATLHELGHIDWWTRCALRIYKDTVDASDIIDYVSRHPDSSVVLDLIDHLEKSPYFDKSWKKVTDVSRRYFSDPTSASGAEYTEALSTLSVLVASETASRNLGDVRSLVDDRSTKVTTISSSLDVERSADEFSSRNGAYAALVSWVKKGQDLETKDGDLNFKPYMWLPAALAAKGLMTFATLFYLPSEDIKGGYDPLIARLSLILETAKHAFHDPNLPDEVKADLHSQITAIEEYVKQAQSSNHFKIRKAIQSWKDNIGVFGRLLKTPFENRLSKDYAKLQDATRALSRNPLYYLADKT